MMLHYPTKPTTPTSRCNRSPLVAAAPRAIPAVFGFAAYVVQIRVPAAFPVVEKTPGLTKDSGADKTGLDQLRYLTCRGDEIGR